MDEWNSRCGEKDVQLDSADLQLMHDNYSSLSYYHVEKKLVTTTTSTFDFNSSLITCYPNKIAFGVWKQQQRAHGARMRGRRKKVEKFYKEH